MLRQKGLNTTIANAARVYQINFGSLTNTPFSDVRVRKALSVAINRKEIVRYVLFDMGKPAAGPYQEGIICPVPRNTIRNIPEDIPDRSQETWS